MKKRITICLAAGFTLVELSIVLIIVALLIGGMLVPLSAQKDLQNTNETQKQLADVKEALLGFAAAQGRLPCPATLTSTGRESFCTTEAGSCTEQFAVPTHGRCTEFFNGFVPAATLGLSPTSNQGLVIDSWGNPLRYAVSDKTAGSVTFFFTKPSGIQSAWTADPIPLQSDLLRICNTAAHITGTGDSADCPTTPTADRMTDSAAAVLFSTGKNGGTAPVSADERANWTNSSDRAFVSATPSPTFDDLVTWLSPSILYNRMITAGRLR